MIMYGTHSNDHLNFDNDVATTNEYSPVLVHKSSSRLLQILRPKILRSCRQFLIGDTHEFLYDTRENVSTKKARIILDKFMTMSKFKLFSYI